MAEILRVKLRWSGFTGAPGYSIFHMRDFEAGGAQAAHAENATIRINSFADKLKGLIPYGSSLQVMSDVEVLEETNGKLLDVITTTSKASVNSIATASMQFAGPVGGVITWRTGVVRKGRRIRGRTFLVPLVSAVFDNQGKIAGTNITQINTAANELRAQASTPDLGVYARPSSPTANDGVWAVVTGHSVPSFGAVLRSRRD